MIVSLKLDRSKQSWNIIFINRVIDSMVISPVVTKWEYSRTRSIPRVLMPQPFFMAISAAAPMILIMWDNQIFVFHDEELFLPIPFMCCEIIDNAINFHASTKIFSTTMIDLLPSSDTQMYKHRVTTNYAIFVLKKTTKWIANINLYFFTIIQHVKGW